MNPKSIILYPYRKICAVTRFLIIAQKIINRRGRPTVWLFGSPNHSNLGDQAQTYCIERWARENYPEHGVFVFRQFSGGDYRLLKILRRIIGHDDILVCHSGYHMTELYPLHENYSKVAETFPDFALTIFPQTVNFFSEEYARKVVSKFDSHPNCTLLCRDEISYSTALRLFRKTRLLLFPDIVTSLIGTRCYTFPREGVLFCMRNDKEAYYKPEQISALRERFSPTRTELTDTTLSLSAKKIIADREHVLEETFSNYARYRVIITDRYHGTIFALIAGTPVVVLSSTDHKLSSGVKWFPKEIFGEYIAFAEDLDRAFELAQKHLENPPTRPLPPCFKEKFYDGLLRKLKESNND